MIIRGNEVTRKSDSLAVVEDTVGAECKVEMLSLEIGFGTEEPITSEDSNVKMWVAVRYPNGAVERVNQTVVGKFSEIGLDDSAIDAIRKYFVDKVCGGPNE